MKFDYDVGIIGGGAAGLSVASGCSQLGAKTVLFEREEKLGGDCLHFGCVPSKTLIHIAKVYHLAKTAHLYGLPKFQDQPVDFCRISRRIAEVIDKIQEHDSEERFCRLGVDTRFGNTVFVDEHSVRCTGKTISAAKWVIATGSQAAIPKINGLDQINYLTNKTIFRLDSLPECMTILGGGAIAVEMAQAFARLGSKVHLLQRSRRILSQEDSDLVSVINQALTDDGVDIHTGVTDLEIGQQSNGIETAFKSEQGRHKIASSKLLAALGRAPVTRDLRLENAGVEFDLQGIKTDSRLRTSQKHIFAAGDVLGHHQYTHAAGYEAGVVVANIMFHLPQKTAYQHMPHCIFTDPELASIGLTESKAKEKGLEFSVWREHFSNNDRAVTQGNEEGFIKILIGKKSRILGVHIAGAGAGDLLGEWATAFASGSKLRTIAAAVHPYPTFAEINKRVAGAYIGSKIFSDKVSKALKFFFNFSGRACIPTQASNPVPKK